MAEDFFPIWKIEPEWVLEPEALGSKRKFWYRRPKDDTNTERTDWLFKYPQPNTGQHWSEKIAAEIAALMDILHARVQLAVFQDFYGSATESFAREGRSLFHGNQILSGQVLGYNEEKRFRQSEHTLENIFQTLEKVFLADESKRKAKVRFAEYLVLDAVIGNTDRHHENWGILRKRMENSWFGMLAPTFDHASSLGRELSDDKGSKCRKCWLLDNRIGNYSEKAPGAIYWNKTDKQGLSPLQLVRKGAVTYPDIFQEGLIKVRKLNESLVENVVKRIPEELMTKTSRDFTIQLVCYNISKLKDVLR